METELQLDTATQPDIQHLVHLTLTWLERMTSPLRHLPPLSQGVFELITHIIPSTSAGGTTAA
jgi:hypothetical protein